MNSDLLFIPPRSTEIQPIENVFKVGKEKFHSDSINGHITTETYGEFPNHVIQTLHYLLRTSTNNTISSMNEQVLLLIKTKGARLKYNVDSVRVSLPLISIYTP